MLSTELAATAEALYDRALVRGEQLMNCRACDVLAIIDASRAPATVGDSPASDKATVLAEKIRLESLEAELAAARQAHAEELRKAQDALAVADALPLELATAKAEKGRFEALALEAATQNEQLQKDFAAALADAAAKAEAIAKLETTVAGLKAAIAASA